MQGLETFWNYVRAQVELVVSEMTPRPTLGIVTSWDKTTHSAKFNLMPKSVPTGWVHVGAPSAGKGCGLSMAPRIGDQAMLVGQEGDPESWHVTHWVHSDEDTPMGLEAGEGAMRGAGGAQIFMDKDGKITVSNSAAGSVTIDGSNIVVAHTSGAGASFTAGGVVTTDETGFQTHHGGGTVRIGGAGASIAVRLSDDTDSTQLFTSG
jgi:phage baseplate assembly protein gpV